MDSFLFFFVIMVNSQIVLSSTFHRYLFYSPFIQGSDTTSVPPVYSKASIGHNKRSIHLWYFLKGTQKSLHQFQWTHHQIHVIYINWMVYPWFEKLLSSKKEKYTNCIYSSRTFICLRFYWILFLNLIRRCKWISQFLLVVWFTKTCTYLNEVWKGFWQCSRTADKNPGYKVWVVRVCIAPYWS